MSPRFFSPLRHAVALVLACSPLFARNALAQDAPQWKFAVGDTLRYEVVQQTGMQTTAGVAGDFATTARQVVNVVWQIDAVDDAGVATGTQQIERIRLEITMPSGLALEYDSDAEEPPSGIAAMLTPMFESLLENKVAIEVSPAGEVRKCELPQPMRERLAAIPATRAMSELVTEAGLRQVAERIALPLPDGDQSAARKVAIENRVLGTLQGEVTWSAASSDDSSDAGASPLARFTPAVTLSIEPAPPVDLDNSSQPPPIQSPSIAEQSVEGAAEFDTQAGRLKHSNMEFSVEIEGKLMGHDITSELDQTIEVTAK